MIGPTLAAEGGSIPLAIALSLGSAYSICRFAKAVLTYGRTCRWDHWGWSRVVQRKPRAMPEIG